MSAYTEADVEAAASVLGRSHLLADLSPAARSLIARAVVAQIAPDIAGRTLREEASPIVIDCRDQGLGLGAAQRAIWRRSLEIEGKP